MGLKASCFYNVTKESDDLFLGGGLGGAHQDDRRH